MLFNSWVFVLFLIIVLGIYYILSRKAQNVFLVIVSYVFYGWWNWRFLLLLALSTIIDYYCGKRIYTSSAISTRKFFLWLSLGVNLGILGFFKYFNFFADSVFHVVNLLGLSVDPPLLEILLPVGISFYTFQTMAYTIDIYRKQEVAAKSFVDFALYVSYFPQLVAGPIERSTNLLPQFYKQRIVTPEKVYTGFQLIIMGYLKKIVIADSAAPLVNQVFNGTVSEESGIVLLLGLYLFALQIYGDFAGYTDIARGVSLLFGIDLCLNFRQPYLSSNITEFWRRWHISLSTWLRDYLYIPLGGNRYGTVMTYRNNMLTMLLGGLWHGASWNFVIWGGLHGLYLAVHKMILKGKKVHVSEIPQGFKNWIVWGLKTFITFNLVCLTWIFFRADTTISALIYVKTIFSNFKIINDKYLLIQLFLTLIGLGVMSLLCDIQCWKRNSEVPFNSEWPFWVRGLVYAGLLLVICLVGENNAQPFIYFQF